MSKRVNVTPGAPKGFEVYGEAKTIGGVRVIEVSPRHYVSPNLAASAYRNSLRDGDGVSGWIVSNDRTREHSDPIPTKAEALRVLAEMAAPRHGNPSRPKRRRR